MFICNIKVNGKLCFKILMIIMGLIVLAIFILSVYKLFGAQKEVMNVKDELIHSDVTEIMPNDYTNVLKAVHEDLGSYTGKDIKLSGYVYRVVDFSDNQFVLARNMLVDSQTYVVGFLSKYDKIKDFTDGTWVEIIGTISKGEYHKKEIPILEVKELKQVQKPQDDLVPPPNNTYIPTSSIL